MISKSFSKALPPYYSHAFFVSFLLVRFLSLAVAISLPLISAPNPCAVCCNQHNNQHKNGNPQPFDIPLHPRHRRFMHDIWYAFWCILRFLTGFAVCHILSSLYLRPQSFDRGRGKGGFFPHGAAIAAPYWQFYQNKEILSTTQENLDDKSANPASDCER